MGLLTGLLTLPLAPVRGVVWLTEQVYEQAEREYRDPALVRRQLEEVEDARRRGDIGEEEAAELERTLVARLTQA